MEQSIEEIRTVTPCLKIAGHILKVKQRSRGNKFSIHSTYANSKKKKKKNELRIYNTVLLNSISSKMKDAITTKALLQ